MAQRNRLTNNSSETDVGSLISGDTIFSIPYFQRPYKWVPERIKQLNFDIRQLVDDNTDVHFLGAVIIHGRRSNPSDPDLFDVIDGQQRITTIFLYLAAAVRTLALVGQHVEAAALFLKYLVINRNTGTLSNYKLHSCKEDRAQLNLVFQDLLSDVGLKDALNGFKLVPLLKSGTDTGPLRNNYRAAVRFFKEEFDEGGLDRVRQVYSAILNQLSIVQIDVWDPTNGPKIFDSLNSRQEPMTIGDLVRNEVFRRVANEHPEIIERVDAEYWQPFYKKFHQDGKNLFDGYFFPYGLTLWPNLKKSEVYSSLRKNWDEIGDPAAIIAALAVHQNSYLDIQIGTNFSQHPKGLALALNRLYRTKLPSSTLPFLMLVSQAAKEEEISEKVAIEILQVIESFLVRRAVCGHEPTGLHAVFKRLWSDCNGDYTAARVSVEISKHKTVVWPTDDELENAIVSRDLYSVGITPFLIAEYDRSLNGDSPLIVSWIEHVLPTKPDSEWFKHFSEDEHSTLKDRLANLLPLSSEMNRALSNKPYAEKRPTYLADSAFKSTRLFAEKVEQWTPSSIELRGKELAAWAVSRWPFAAAKSI